MHIERTLLNHVLASAVEAETVGLFHLCQKAGYFRIILEALRHPQLDNPDKTNSYIAATFVNDTLKKLGTYDITG